MLHFNEFSDHAVDKDLSYPFIRDLKECSEET